MAEKSILNPHVPVSRTHEELDSHNHEELGSKNHEEGGSKNHEEGGSKNVVEEDSNNHVEEDSKTGEEDSKTDEEDSTNHEEKDSKNHEEDSKSHELEDSKSHELEESKNHEEEDSKNRENDSRKHEASDSKAREENDSKNHEESARNRPKPQSSESIIKKRVRNVAESLRLLQIDQAAWISSQENMQDLIEVEMDMDIDYLKKSFPDISEESLKEIYLMNYADLEDSIDMLSQLEVFFYFMILYRLGRLKVVWLYAVFFWLLYDAEWKFIYVGLFMFKCLILYSLILSISVHYFNFLFDPFSCMSCL